MAGNPQMIQAGLGQRNRIVELVEGNARDGGDGMTRTELAAELGVSKPTLRKHLHILIEEGRVKQVGLKVLPSDSEHVHICRTCGETMHADKK